ncbi:hypothetical protein HDV06_001686 [Boothiomyces sp. JEL0866]|nr:hypothetical protein HDV06_001686 [Boothiomyces sp. JEL0866]
MAVFFSLALMILGYSLSNCKFYGRGFTGIINLMIIATIAAQSIYIISLLVLASGVDDSSVVPLEILGNLCDIVNTCLLEFAYVIRLKACLMTEKERLIANALWVYPILYPIADIISIAGYFNPDLGAVSALIWNITNIGLLVQEIVVHSWFFKEMTKLFQIGKGAPISLWITITVQFIYMIGFLLSLVFSILYENPIAVELIYLFWSINIALIHPLMKEILAARETKTGSNKGDKAADKRIISTAAKSESNRNFVAVFGGQGQNNFYFSELQLLYKEHQSRLQELVEIASKVLEWPLLDWITDKAPNARKLASLRVSCPLIGLTQLCHYYISCLEHDLSPQEFNQSFAYALGHSQGLVSAVAVSASTTMDDFKDNFSKAIELLFSIGKRASEFWIDSNNSDASLSPMLSVNGLTFEQLEELVSSFNGTTKHVVIGLVNSSKSMVLCGPEPDLSELSSILQQMQSDNEKIQFKFLPIEAPFHTHHLKDCLQLVLNDLGKDFWKASMLNIPVLDTFDGSDLRECTESLTKQILELIFEKQLHWLVVCDRIEPGHVVDFGPGKSYGIGKITARNLKSSNVNHIHMETHLFLNFDQNYSADELVLHGYTLNKSEMKASLGLDHKDHFEALTIESELVIFIEKQDLDLEMANTLLAEYLPSAIPSVVLALENLPKDDGKIDSGALQSIDISNYAMQILTKDEKIIASLIIDILELNRKYLLPDSDFFSLGGDSISVVLLSNACFKRNIHLSPADIFSLKTVKKLAAKSKITKEPIKRNPIILDPQIEKEICSRFNLDTAECYPCTSMQEAMFGSTLEKSSAYLDHAIWIVKDGENPVDYYDAWLKVVAKHQILKSGVCIVDSTVYQFVSNHYVPNLEVLEGQLSDFLAKDKLWGFSENNPFWARATILNDNKVSYFIYSFHHVNYDGWSLGIFFKDFEHARLDSLDSTVVEYKPFIEFYHSQDLQEIQKYWLCYLDGTIPSSMFTKRIPSKENSFQSVDYKSVFTVSSLKKAAFYANSTQAIILKAAWGITLQIFAANQDVTFGEVVSGREIQLEGIQDITGPIISCVPCRVRANEKNIIDLLQEMTTEYLEKSNYSAVGLGQIQSWMSVKSLVESLFVFQNNKRHTFSDPSLCPINLDKLFYVNHMSFPIGITIFPQENSYSLNFAYLPWLVSADYCKQFINVFQAISNNIINCCLQRNNVPVSKIKALPSEMTNIVLIHGAGSPMEIKHTLAHHAFEEIAENHPDLTALEQYGKKMSYGALNANAKNLGQFLVKENVQVGEFIPIITTRSFEFIVGIFGVLKAGGAYIPIDNSMPIQRITTIVTEAQAKKALVHYDSDPKLVEALYELGITVYSLDYSLYPKIESVASRSVKGSDPAYVVFTSGSTGKPKGVVIRHKSLTNYATIQIPNAYKVDHMKWANVVSINFDTCESDIFICLSNYSTLVLKEADSFDSLREVEAMDITPSLLKSLNPDDYPNIKQIIVGGEALDRELVDKWSPIVKLYNTYGPSEITIACTSLLVSPDIETITIGRPFANVKLYIVDKGLNLVPVGVPGELVVGGTGVALGYLYRPDLTDERFIDDIFSNDGSKMYKTGDVCKWTEKGEIEFLGRDDDMVKLNGYRIELNEVKNNLKLVDSAEVVVADGKLVAFVTPQKVDIAQILDLALDSMPFYMVPSVIIPMDSLPLTTNGKVDKKALMQMEIKVEFEKPETDIEIQLANLWAGLLKINVTLIGKNSSFFELGGDSLLLIQMTKRSKEIGLPLTSALVFQKQTLARIAAMYVKDLPKGKPVVDFAILNVNDSIKNQILSKVKPNDPSILDIYPATPMQASIYLKTLVEPNAYCFQISWKVATTIDPSILEESLSKVIKAHPALRTRFFLTDKGVYQAVQKPFYHKLTIVKDVARYLKTRAKKGFLLTEYCYFKMVLVEKQGKYTDLVFSIHHVLYDGWSLGRAINDLFGSMEGKKVFPSTSIKGLPQYIVSNRKESKQYFQNYLNGATMPDFNPSCYDYSKTVKKISREFLVPLGDVSKAASMLGVTSAMIFKSVWGLVLASYTGKNQVLFGNMYSGRDLDVENIEDVVGCVIHVSPTRLQIDQNMELVEYLKIVQADSFATSLHHPSLSSYIKWSGSIPWHPKLWNSVFYYQNMPTSSNQGYSFANGNIKLDYSSFYREFDINLMIEPSESVIRMNFYYLNIKPSFAQELASAFEKMFTSIVQAVLTKQNLRLGDLFTWNDVQDSGCCSVQIPEIVTPTVLKGVLTPSSWGTIYKVVKLGLEE